MAKSFQESAITLLTSKQKRRLSLLAATIDNENRHDDSSVDLNPRSKIRNSEIESVHFSFLT